MAGWTTSTQRARWLFKPQQLEEMRRQVNAATAAQVARLFESAAAQQASEQPAANPDAPPGSTDGGTGAAEDGGGNERKRKRTREKEEAEAPVVGVEEEKEILKYYHGKIVAVCQAFQFQPKVQATAILYFKRFFLKHSVMEYDPKSIMLTVVYVACKIEEAYVSAASLGGGIKQNPQIVLDHELTVLQALDFDLICHGPYKPLEGILLDWREREPELFKAEQPAGTQPTAVQDLLKVVRQASAAQLPLLLTSDAPLLFPPTQLALAAITLALRPPSPLAHLLPHLKKYMALLSKAAPPPPPQGQPQATAAPPDLESAVGNVILLVEQQGAPPDEGRVRRIDRKLKQCRDPTSKTEDVKKKKEKKAKKGTQDTQEGVPGQGEGF